MRVKDNTLRLPIITRKLTGMCSSPELVYGDMCLVLPSAQKPPPQLMSLHLSSCSHLQSLPQDNVLLANALKLLCHVFLSKNFCVLVLMAQACLVKVCRYCPLLPERLGCFAKPRKTIWQNVCSLLVVL